MLFYAVAVISALPALFGIVSLIVGIEMIRRHKAPDPSMEPSVCFTYAAGSLCSFCWIWFCYYVYATLFGV